MKMVINQTATANLNERKANHRQIQEQSQVVIEHDVMFHWIIIQDHLLQREMLIEIHVPHYLEAVLPLQVSAGVRRRVTATCSMCRFSVSMTGKSLVTMVR